MGALQYVDRPNYAALLLRKDFQRLSKPGALIPRLESWLKGTPAKWSAANKTWHFPGGATITFGFLEHPSDRLQYSSSEFQYIGVDEVSDFDKESYLFMFSRLRRNIGSDVPLRMRSASNPSLPGYRWLKDRFISREAIEGLARGESRTYWIDDRAFVPALLKDNPYIDQESYIKSLSHLPPVTRARLLAGDWSVTDMGQIKPDWIRHWTPRGEYYSCRIGSDNCREVHPSQCMRFTIVDCAGSSEDVAREKRNENLASWSVIQTWEFVRQLGWLILRNQRRGRWDFPRLLNEIREEHAEHRPAWIGIEDEKTGRAALQSLRELSTRALSHEGKDKLTRAAKLLNLAEQGKVFLPRDAKFYETLEMEWLSWDGHPDTTADQIDPAAYAAIHADRNNGTWGGVINIGR